MRGSVTKRCPCPPERNAKGERLACKKKHGSWSYVVDLGRVDGKRRQEKRGGFRTKDDAEEAMNAVIDALNKGTHAHDDGITLRAFLLGDPARKIVGWVDGKVADGKLRPTTERGYRMYIRDHIAPQLGHLRLRDLRPAHVSAMLRTVKAGPVSVRRVHGVLRSALASAKRQQLVAFNAAADIELPAAPRPKVRPWEPADLGKFLDSLGGDRLAPLFELIAATGLRRGEACGLRWSDVDLERGRLTVNQQLVQVSTTTTKCPSCAEVHKGHVFGPPKTRSGDARLVTLDGGTVGVLLAHQLTQSAERAQWGSAYVDHDLVFAREDGNPLPLDHVTKRFRELVVAAGLRPIRLHDLRHGAASMMLASGLDIALVSKRLGHSSISITADTYSHLLENVDREAADRTAALLAAHRAPRGDQQPPAGDHSKDAGDQSVTTPPDSAETVTREEVSPPRSRGVSGGAPPGTRTPNPLVKSQLLCQLS
jgi:integrase